jgi:hypothetical protein
MPRLLLAAALFLALSPPALLAADPATPQPPAPSPLHSQIDALIDRAAIGPLSPLCSDADFVRRIYLDLTGVIPTADQARTFVEDKNSDKRPRLIDDLLASPAFIRHMTITFDLILMQRLPEKTIKQQEWEAYLYNSIAADKPFDQLFRELIETDGAAADRRAAAKFFLCRDAEPNLLTRDLGRLVFGLDLQCCQCHDHPLIDDYYQDDYYGLFAFVNRTALFTDAKTKLVSLTEKADGEASFKSVFTGASSDKATPRLPKGPLLLVEPTFTKGEEYSVKPAKDVRGVPKFSRRAALAEFLPTSREFSRNLANRLWATMFGRGLVHPLDFHSATNPPSNPQLLTLLADALAGQLAPTHPLTHSQLETWNLKLETKPFHLRPFLRELALTRAYQRSCEPPRPDSINFTDIAARLDQLHREKAAQQKSLAPLQESLATAKAAFKTARDEDAAIAAELPKLEKSLAAARHALEKLAAQRRAAQDAAANLRQQAQSVAKATAKLAAAAKALSGDQTLAAAVEQISAHSKQLDEHAAFAAKSLHQPTGQQADAAQQLATAESALAAAIAKRPAPTSLRDLESQQLSAQSQLSDAHYSIALCDSQISLAKSLLDYAALAKTDSAKADAAWSAIIEKWTIRHQVAALKPLTAEQFAASTMQATGMLPTQARSASEGHAVKAELDLLTKLRPTFAEFIRQYGSLPGEEFQATVNQALFFSNGNTIDAWLKPSGENLLARLSKLDDDGALIDNLYWSIHSRPPTETERRAAADYLKSRASDKPAAASSGTIAELAWALLSSTEFRFNH